MAIQLRTNKASALTYNEMDRNFSSFFYSASIDNGNMLKLWYTGSSTLNTAPGDDFGPARFVPIDLQPTTGATPTLVVAGDPRTIQFRHSSNPILDADNAFLYNTSLQLGVGTATPAANAKIHAKGTNTIPATLRLESTTTAGLNKRTAVDFYQGATNMGTVGRHDHNDNNFYIKTYTPFINGATPGDLRLIVGNPAIASNPSNIGAFTPTGFGVGTFSPQHLFHTEGNGYFAGRLGVGTGPNAAALHVFQTAQTGTVLGDFETIAQFGIIPQGSVDSLKILSVRQLAGGNNWWSNGMRIQQDVDGTYRTYIQFSGEGNLHGFSIGTGQSTSPHKPGDIGIVERFRINSTGDISINKSTPNAKLDVNGDTIITGSFTVKGNTVTTGNATIQTIAAGSAGTTSALVATSAGLVQKIDAAPIPKGGIILWSGAILDKPAGWYLCDGTNGTPDLRDRFVVGAGSTYAVGNTGGSTTHTHTAQGTALTINQLPAHQHEYQDAYFAENFGTKPNGNEAGSGDTDSDNGYLFRARNGDASASPLPAGQMPLTSPTGSGATHTHTLDNATSLPPYYALAYIMYGGI
jgi:hypothetical protein